MVLIQLGVYFIPYFILVNGSCGKKGKGAYLQKNEISRQTRGGGAGLKSGKETDCPRVFSCSDIYMQQLLFLAFFSATRSNEDHTMIHLKGKIELKMEKKQICESDSWF